jgi:hypothetical protein
MRIIGVERFKLHLADQPIEVHRPLSVPSRRRPGPIVPLFEKSTDGPWPAPGRQFSV